MQDRLDPRKLPTRTPPAILDTYIGDRWVCKWTRKKGNLTIGVVEVLSWRALLTGPTFEARQFPLASTISVIPRNIVRQWGTAGDRLEALTLALSGATGQTDVQALMPVLTEMAEEAAGWATPRWLDWTAANVASIMGESPTPEIVRLRLALEEGGRDD